MSTIAEKLVTLNTVKDDIKNAIVAKGGTLDNDSDFTSYADAIKDFVDLDFSSQFIIPIQHGAGLMDFSIVGGKNVLWKLADGTTSTSSHPAVTLPAGTSYLYASNLSDSAVEVHGYTTKDNYTGDIKVFSQLTGVLDLSAVNNAKGNIVSLNKLTTKISIANAGSVYGDISVFNNISTTIYLISIAGIYGVLNPTSTVSVIRLVGTGISSDDLDQTIINLDTNTKVSGSITLTGLTRSSASTSAINSLIAKGWSVTDATIYDDPTILSIVHSDETDLEYEVENGTDVLWTFADGTTSTESSGTVTLPSGITRLSCSNLGGVGVAVKFGKYIIPIKCSAGLMDFSITNGDNVLWKLADGTTSTSSHPAVTLPAGTSYLYASNLSDDIIIKDNSTDSNYVGNIKVFNILNSYIGLTKTNAHGLISAFNNCTERVVVTDNDDIYGVLNPTPTLRYVYLQYNGLSSNDVDQTIINLDTNTTTVGYLNVKGMTRSSASTSYINSLIAKGWSVQDATVVD